MKMRAVALLGSALLLSPLLASTPATAADDGSITASALPSLLQVSEAAAPVSYDRARFEHWIDADGDGCNTRYEVLIEESTTPVAISAGCKLTGGTWISPYDGFAANTPSGIEIDHVVALAEAWRSGAWSWSDAERRDFANDLDVPYALTAASTVSNQSKSDKDPARWLPSNDSHVCEYVVSWAMVKYRWGLTVDHAEFVALTEVLTGACGATPVALPAVALSKSDPADGTSHTDDGRGAITTFAPGLTRLSGGSRYETALAISHRYAPGVSTAFVATGADFPDALSAAAAASSLGGPLLLTPPNALPAAVGAELKRLEPERIIAVGGPGAVGSKVLATLKGIAPTTRIGGANRYDTAHLIVQSLFSASDTAFIATGRTFPDALAATGAAGSLDAPVVLVDGAAAALPARTLALLHSLGVRTVSVAGETGAVSAKISTQLSAAGFDVRRLGGASRYETAAAINNAYFPAGTSGTVFVATGTNFPDALAGAALAGSLSAPMHITHAACTPAAVRASIADLGAAATVVLGGTAVVSDAAARNLGCLASSRPTISGTPQVGKSMTVRVGAWTPGTTFTYQWYANGRAIAGATSNIVSLAAAQQGTRLTVTVTGRRSEHVTVARTSAATAAVAAAVRPSRTSPVNGTCPSWAPIKGNASSMIYHLPGGQYYDRTNPEECFATEAAAREAGYRRSLR